MPLVTADYAQIIANALRADFTLAYNQPNPSDAIVSRIASVIDSPSGTLDLSVLGQLPQMSEWVSERRIRELAAGKFTVTDKTWEATVGIPRRALEDDDLGLIRARVNELATEVRRHKLQLVTELLATGTAQTCFDGGYLLSATHGESGTSQSNVTSNALTVDNVAAGMAAMMAFQGDQGKPMGIMPDVLLVGPKLYFQARQITTSPNLIAVGVGGSAAVQPAANAIAGQLEVIMSPYLVGSYDDYWFLLDTTRAIKSVILQQNSNAPVEVTTWQPNTIDVINFSVRARYVAAPGLWQAVYAGIL